MLLYKEKEAIIVMAGYTMFCWLYHFPLLLLAVYVESNFEQLHIMNFFLQLLDNIHLFTEQVSGGHLRKCTQRTTIYHILETATLQFKSYMVEKL